LPELSIAIELPVAGTFCSESAQIVARTVEFLKAMIITVQHRILPELSIAYATNKRIYIASGDQCCEPTEIITRTAVLISIVSIACIDIAGIVNSYAGWRVVNAAAVAV
jgi:hypothetical protein